MDDPTKHPDHPDQRFLVPGAPTGRFQSGYSEIPELAMRQEPECLDEDDWEKHVGKEARIRLAALQATEERELLALSLEERFEKCIARGAVRRLDISREVFVLRQMFARGEKVDKLNRKVQDLEAVVHFGRRVAA